MFWCLSFAFTKIYHYADFHFSKASKQWKCNITHITPYMPLEIQTPWLSRVCNRNRPQQKQKAFRGEKKDVFKMILHRYIKNNFSRCSTIFMFLKNYFQFFPLSTKGLSTFQIFLSCAISFILLLFLFTTVLCKSYEDNQIASQGYLQISLLNCKSNFFFPARPSHLCLRGLS